MVSGMVVMSGMVVFDGSGVVDGVVGDGIVGNVCENALGTAHLYFCTWGGGIRTRFLLHG